MSLTAFLKVSWSQTVHKRKSWTKISDGKVILYWFDEGVCLNHESYLDILRTFVWPRFRRKVADQDLWWQQDGATAHTVEIVRNWLDNKFDGRVISNKMTHFWPPCSPDLSPLDFWFWGHAMHHLKTTKLSGHHLQSWLLLGQRRSAFESKLKA